MTLGSIKLIRLRADHNMILPDGKACMKFYPEAYNILELSNYTPDHSGDTTLYIPSVKRDTSLIPEDLLPEGLFNCWMKRETSIQILVSLLQTQ